MPGPAVPGSQLATPSAAMMSRDVDAFGFLCRDKDHINPASNLAGIYVSCTWWFFPIPCLLCRRFTAPEPNTLILSNACCAGCPDSGGCGSCLKEAYTRNWDENQFPGPPNSFSADRSGTTFEFGAVNGLCAGSSETVCYMRIC
eukprot:1697893-Prymnesium_polylepis.1